MDSFPSERLLEAVKNAKPKSLQEVKDFDLLRKMFYEGMELSCYLFNTDDPLAASQKHLSSLDRLVDGVQALIDRHSLTSPMLYILIQEVSALRNNVVDRIKELQESING